MLERYSVTKVFMYCDMYHSYGVAIIRKYIIIIVFLIYEMFCHQLFKDMRNISL